MKEEAKGGFSFYKNYWFSIQNLSEEEQKDIVYGIVKYAFTNEMPPLDNIAHTMVDAWHAAIERSVEQFDKNAEIGKKGGRQKKLKDGEIKKAIMEHPNFTSAQIAELLGVAPVTIRRSDEWGNRHLYQN